MRPRARLLPAALLGLGLLATAACSGDGKPSKEEVREGYAETIAGPTGGVVPGGASNPMITCVVDAIYDELSAESLQLIADGEDYPDDDLTVMLTATEACLEETVGS